jgi:hypothetical protein
VSEAVITLCAMSRIIDLAEWQRRRADAGPALLAEESEPADPSIARLEAAIQGLHGLVSRALDGRGHLEPGVETELLAIMGELTVGLVPEAASRAERLAARLAAGEGGG